jgi:NAD(P)-dependent dehydrogenase (short-subunit alcohol dehydrogenase family)
MSRVLVTGSNDGIGAGIAEILATNGHQVVRHARNAGRAVAGEEFVLGDFASLTGVRAMAAKLREQPPLDVIVHNAGWASPDEVRPVTEDGFEQTFQIHVLAPYLLTALLPLPRRIVFVNSDSIRRGVLDPADLNHEKEWTSAAAYADSKLAQAALTLGLARRYPDVLINAVHPGWVRTKMSPPEAPLDIAEGAGTPVWLATSNDPDATVTGAYFQLRKQVRLNEALFDVDLQDAVLAACAELTGVALS